MNEDAAGGAVDFEQGTVRGFLHSPDGKAQFGVVLTHGAGTNSDTPLLKAVAAALVRKGFAVLRYDLPFRQRRRTGPPHPSSAVADRAGLLEAATILRDVVDAPVILAGHSYGGRQASILATEHKACCCALLLLSYPLHPPAKPEQLRTAHFPKLKTPALFVQGWDDPFASEAELRLATEMIPATTAFSFLAGAGHDLCKGKFDVEVSVVEPLTRLLKEE